MKYLQLPCDYFEQPNIRQAIRKDEGFGEQVLFNLIMKIGHEFQMGDWIKTGLDFKLVPFAYDLNINDWHRACKIKSNEHGKFMEQLDEFKKCDVIDYEKTQYSIWISVPQVAQMTDETNRKTCKKLFGVPHISKEEMQNIIEGNSRTIQEQTRLENIKINNTTTDNTIADSLANNRDDNNIYNNTSSPAPEKEDNDDDTIMLTIGGKKISFDEYKKHLDDEQE
tara:strand:+ start:115 stop:786 length:672 start_codon:yes stop_codon:yes gene_type:complete